MIGGDFFNQASQPQYAQAFKRGAPQGRSPLRFWTQLQICPHYPPIHVYAKAEDVLQSYVAVFVHVHW